MGARELTTVVDQMTFTECPRWRDGRLYFSDFYTYRVMSVVPGRDAEEIVSVPQQPSGSAGCPTGGCSSCRCGTARSCARSSPASSSSTPT